MGYQKRRCGCLLDAVCVCKRCVMCNKTPQRPVWIFCDCTPRGYGRNRCYECLFMQKGESKAIPALPLIVKGSVKVKDFSVEVIAQVKWRMMVCTQCEWTFDPNNQNGAEFRLPYQEHRVQYAHHMSNHVRSLDSFLCWSRDCDIKKVGYEILAAHLRVDQHTQFCMQKEYPCTFCEFIVKGCAPTYDQLMLMHWSQECKGIPCVYPCATIGTLAEIQICFIHHEHLLASYIPDIPPPPPPRLPPPSPFTCDSVMRMGMGMGMGIDYCYN